MRIDYQKHPDPKRQLSEILSGKSTGKPKHAKPLVLPLLITLPLPPSECWPNRANKGWRAVSKARKWLKASTVMECGRQGVPAAQLKTVTAQPTFYFGDARKRDRDGAASALKSMWDGLEAYGLIENDSGLSPLMPIFAIDRVNPRLEVLITSLSPSVAGT